MLFINRTYCKIHDWEKLALRINKTINYYSYNFEGDEQNGFKFLCQIYTH